MKLVSALALATSSFVAMPALASAMTCKAEQPCEKAEKSCAKPERKATQKVEKPSRRGASGWCQSGEFIARCGIPQASARSFY